jgi:hypothetical protein
MSTKKLKDYNPKDIIGYEVRHSTFCPPPEPGMPDIHLIKRVAHVKEGDKTVLVPHIVVKKNFERKFWIERPGAQNHREKREFQDMENLQEFTCTETELQNKARKEIVERTEKARKRFELPFPSERDITLRKSRNPYLYGTAISPREYTRNMRLLARSPYLYGTDVSSTTLIKKMYMDMFPQLRSQSSVAATDVETNMFSKEQEIIMQTISFKERIFTAIKRDFFKGYTNIEEKLHEAARYYIGDVFKARNITWEVILVDTAADVVKAVIAKAHDWQPDFLAIWNIKFDMVKMLEALTANGDDPAQVFSHPTMPDAYKFFEFTVGPSSKTTASGVHKPLGFHEQWHVAATPASFYFIDAMCVYRQVRQGQQEEPSYKLDAIMDKYLNRGKLKFTEADGYSDGAWHEFMQEFYKVEYVVYNVFDCVGMEMLDEKTADLNLNFPLYSGPSDYAIFPSQPKKLCNKFFFELLKEDRVLASTSDTMRDENDDRTVIGKGWITMLPAHLVLDTGLKCLEEMTNVASNIRIGVGDLDIAGTYPNEGICMNISKYTTHRELLYIEGIPDHIRRRIGFNLAGGHVNALEICHDLYKAPTLDQMYQSYLRHQQLQQSPPVLTENQRTVA